jgi:tetratricopeptide (TPR) repeat protein
MARCERCGAELGIGASFCSQCGTPTHVPTAGEAPAREPAEPTSRAFPLLARANLLRMRGRWQEAAGLCAEVLRLEPGNASAYSLLGDIHENQGNLDEAIHWYDLALRVNPRSEADAAKRGRAHELLEARQRRAEWQAATERASQPPGSGALLREAVQRVVAVAGAAVCAVILVAAVVVSAGERTPAPSTDEPPVPIRRREQSSVQLARSAREEADLQQLADHSRSVTGHGQVDTLLIDPRTGEAILTVILPRASTHRPSLLQIRDQVLRDALWMAHALYQIDPNLPAIEVRAHGDTSFSAVPGKSDLLFVGSFAAENLVEDPDARPPVPEDLPGMVRDTPWWYPALRG